MSHQWHIVTSWTTRYDQIDQIAGWTPHSQFQGKSTKLQVPYVDISLVSSLCSLLDARLTSNNLEPWKRWWWWWWWWWWFRLRGIGLKLHTNIQKGFETSSCSLLSAGSILYLYPDITCWFRISSHIFFEKHLTSIFHGFPHGFPRVFPWFSTGVPSEDSLETWFAFCTIFAMGSCLAEVDGIDYRKLFSNWWKNEILGAGI